MQSYLAQKIDKAYNLFLTDEYVRSNSDKMKVFEEFFKQDILSVRFDHLSTYVITHCIQHNISAEIYGTVIPYFSDIPKIEPDGHYDTIVKRFLHTREKLKLSEFRQGQQIRRLLLDIAKSQDVLLTIYYCFAFEWINNPASTDAFFQIDEPLLEVLNDKTLLDTLKENYIKYKTPVLYKRVTQAIGVCIKTRESTLRFLSKRIQSLVKNEIRDVAVTSRNKSVHSILDKMERKNLAIEDIIDKSALRILVPTVEDCYKAETLLYINFFPEKKYHKDYIQNPKKNGYQSIHTVIHDPILGLVECQIRTHQMHRNSTQGSAAHSIYKSRDGSLNTIDTAMLNRFLKQSQRLNIVTADFVYVLTPRNQIIEMTHPATPIDLAYALHTQLGHQCAGALINGKIRPLNTKLTTGDVVEIIKQKSHLPPRSWLDNGSDFVLTKKARRKVMQYHQVNKLATNSLDGIIKRIHAIGEDINVNTSSLHHLAKLNNFRHTASFLKHMSSKSDEFIKRVLLPYKPALSEKKVSKDKLEAFLAHCCYPVPSDEIVGYISLKGCHIHRSNCRNLINQSDHRKLRLEWTEIETMTPQLVFSLTYTDSMSKDLKSLLSDCNVSILSSYKRKRTVVHICAISMPPYHDFYRKIQNYAIQSKNQVKVRRYGESKSSEIINNQIVSE